MASASSYRAKKRSLERKIKIVEDLGGCQICGYGVKPEDNLAALSFHHLNPETKTAIPSIILRSEGDLSEVLNETVLVCQNCHLAIHHPQLKMSNLDRHLQTIEEEIERGTRDKNPLNNFSDSELSKICGQYGAKRKLFRELGITDKAGYMYFYCRGIKKENS